MIMLLSVVIPIYNCEKYLSQCLDSIIACPLTSMECILVNDGSVDSSLLICNQYQEKDSRFRIITQSNAGVSTARNTGIEAATGDYIMFLDADDYLDQQSLELLISDIREHRYQFVAYSYHSLYSNRMITDEYLCESESTDDKDLIEEYMYASSKLNMCWGKLFQSEIIRNNNLWFRPEIKIGEDFIFVAEYFGCCNSFLLRKQCLLYYRQHGESAMRKYSMQARLDFLQVLYDFNKELVREKGSSQLRYKMSYYYFCMITDLFLDFAKKKPSVVLLPIYQEARKRQPTVDIIEKLDPKIEMKLYKKLEYKLLKQANIRLLVIHFRLKAFLDQKRA